MSLEVIHNGENKHIKEKNEKFDFGFQKIPEKSQKCLLKSPISVNHNDSREDYIDLISNDAVLEASDLISAMKKYRYRKEEKIKNERRQELIERDFQNNLTTIEELEKGIDTGEEGVKKEEIKFGDDKITIFRVFGKNMCFLQHTVDYRLSPDNFNESNGYKESRKLFENPASWIQKDNDNLDAISNTVSCSYIDTDINILHGGATSFYGVTYGFTAVKPDTVIGVYDGDGETLSNIGEMPGNEGEYEEFSSKRLAKNSTRAYNEVLVRRYNEQGVPILPNFLVVYDDNITEDTLRHASFFGVPVVDIAKEPYIKKQREYIQKEFDRLDSQSDYYKIFKALMELSETSLDINLISHLKKNKYDQNNNLYEKNFSWSQFSERTRDKMKEIINKVEPIKRLDLLKRIVLEEESRKTLSIEKNKETQQILISKIDRQFDKKDQVEFVKIEANLLGLNNKPIKIETIIKETDPEYDFWRNRC